MDIIVSIRVHYLISTKHILTGERGLAMSDKEKFTFTTVRGVVLDEQVRVKTSVYGSIGSNSAGYTSGSINSSTREEQQFWLQKDDGQELHIDLRSLRGTVPLRKGHRVIVAYFENRTRPSGIYIENTNTSYTIWHEHEPVKVKPYQGSLAIVVPGLLAYMSDLVVAGITFAVLAGYFWYKRALEIRKQKQREMDIADGAGTYLKHYAATLKGQGLSK